MVKFTKKDKRKKKKLMHERNENNKNNITITYYNPVSYGTNSNVPYNETGYTAANITQGQ